MAQTNDFAHSTEKGFGENLFNSSSSRGPDVNGECDIMPMSARLELRGVAVVEIIKVGKLTPLSGQTASINFGREHS